MLDLDQATSAKFPDECLALTRMEEGRVKKLTLTIALHFGPSRWIHSHDLVQQQQILLTIEKENLEKKIRKKK